MDTTMIWLQSEDKINIQVNHDGEISEIHYEDLIEVLEQLHQLSDITVFTNKMNWKIMEKIEELSGLSTFKFIKASENGSFLLEKKGEENV